jgi:ribonucleoside-triphosphate reductase
MDEVAAADTRHNAAYLFTTKTCPNCKAAKEYLRDYPYIMVDAEDNPELTREYGVMQAPTLVVVENGQYKKYANASNIKGFAEGQLTCV